jgi:hypothetical protein
MARVSKRVLTWSLPRMTSFRKGLMAGSVVASVVLLGGCAVEVLNTQAAQELKQASHPPGSVYAGWRVFQSGLSNSARSLSVNRGCLRPVDPLYMLSASAALRSCSARMRSSIVPWATSL